LRRRLSPVSRLCSCGLVALLSLFGAFDPASTLGAIKNEILYTMIAFVAFFAVTREDLTQLLLGLEAAIALILLARGGFITRWRKGLIASLAGVVVLASGILLIVQQERLQAGSVSAASEDVRFRLWPAVVERVAEKPLMGSGYGRGVMSQAHRDLIPKDNASLWRAHNILLNYALQTGVLGMLALAWLILLREYWRFCNAPNDKLKLLGIAGIMPVAGVILRNQANDEFLRDASVLFWSLNGTLLGFGHRRRLQVDSGAAA
jgi:O-antigen ligase